MKLIPVPRTVTKRSQIFIFPAELFIQLAGTSPALPHLAGVLASEISARAGSRCHVRNPGSSTVPATIELILAPGPHPQGYCLEIRPSTITLEAPDEAGLCNGIQTLRQIIASLSHRSLACRTIRDWPDFAVRGFYHDVTRGKVPTLATLKGLADKMASYKLNQLQLYVEHTFAFSKHPDIWEGADPLTAGEIRELDTHCRLLNIDLVPSLSTFGHFYTALRSARKEHLNELEIKASERPFSFWDRMAHYTLDCSNPESLKLVEEMLEEYLPLFSSKYFNICCDETFDLGKGRNATRAAAAGTGALYFGFLKKIMAIVRRHGKTPMFWGDIILKHPELIRQLPKEAVVLNWDYNPVIEHGPCRPFHEAGLRYYVCPGVQGWNNFLCHLPNSAENILNYAKEGLRYKAEGLLNTDWGDYGHINLLATGYYGMILGAAAAWNLKGIGKRPAFDTLIEECEFGDTSHRTLDILGQAARAMPFNWKFLVWWFSPSADMATWERDGKTGLMAEPLKRDAREYQTAYRTLYRLREELITLAKRAAPADPLTYRELICGLTGAMLLQAVALLLQTASGRSKLKHGLSFMKVADEIRSFEREFSDLWHLRNKPSEYWRIKEILIGTARKLDALA